ncbi:MAG: hypothetical protein ACK41F_13820 [Fimbriimonadaceae bacterium]
MRLGWKRPADADEAWGSDSVSRKVQLGLDALRSESLEPSVGIEALKDRILQDSLAAPRRPAWVWAAPVAASLALAFWLGVAVRTVPPAATVGSEPAAGVARIARADSPRLVAKPSQQALPQPAVESASAEPARTVDAPAGAVALRIGRDGARPMVVAQSSPMLASDADPKPESVAFGQSEALAAPPDPPTATDDADEQIVLIHATEDTETGAASAVELESSANVLVGG